MSSRTAVAVVLAVSLPLPIQAHDIYTHLLDGRGKSCRNDRDCRPAHYRVTSKGLQMFVDGRWIDVPSSAIQYLAIPVIRARPVVDTGAVGLPTSGTSATQTTAYTSRNVRSCRPNLHPLTSTDLVFQESSFAEHPLWNRGSPVLGSAGPIANS
jgi:hypothetical protein